MGHTGLVTHSVGICRHQYGMLLLAFEKQLLILKMIYMGLPRLILVVLFASVHKSKGQSDLGPNCYIYSELAQ